MHLMVETKSNIMGSVGGYFDGSGVHWMLADAIGSVELVIDGKGRVEQSSIRAITLTGSRGANPSGSPICSGARSGDGSRRLATATSTPASSPPPSGRYTRNMPMKG